MKKRFGIVLIVFISSVSLLAGCKPVVESSKLDKPKLVKPDPEPNPTPSPSPAPSIEEFQISFSVSEKDMGNIDASIRGKKIKSGSNVKKGEKIKFSVKSNSGHIIAAWKINGKEVPDLQKTTEYSEIVDRNLDVQVLFKKAGKMNLTFFANEGGSLKAVNMKTKKDVSTGEEIDAGTEIKFTAEAKEGFKIKCWKENGAEVKLPSGKPDTKKEHTLTIRSNSEIEVVFERKLCTVNFNVPKGAVIRAFVEGKEIKKAEKVEYGKKVMFTVTVNKGFQITHWELNKKIIDKSENMTEYTVTAEKNIEIKVVTQKAS